MRTFVKVAAAAAVCLWLVGVAAMAAQGGGATLNKPLARFTIGDLFPRFSAGLRETAASWKSTSDAARTLASSGLRNAREAMPPVKAQLEQAKKDAKAAEKSKDFVAAGTAQGNVKTEQTVLDVLGRLEDVASAQNDLADAWAKAGDQMRKFADADEAFDRYRSSGIAKPEQGQRDTRLSQAGYEAFRSRAQALKDLGDAFGQLSGKINGLGAGQLKFADDLQKGGHIQTPPVK